MRTLIASTLGLVLLATGTAHAQDLVLEFRKVQWEIDDPATLDTGPPAVPEDARIVLNIRAAISPDQSISIGTRHEDGRDSTLDAMIIEDKTPFPEAIDRAEETDDQNDSFLLQVVYTERQRVGDQGYVDRPAFHSTPMVRANQPVVLVYTLDAHAATAYIAILHVRSESTSGESGGN